VISKPRETDTMGFAHPGNKRKHVGNKGRRPVRTSVKGKKKKERKEQKSKTTKSVIFIDPLKNFDSFFRKLIKSGDIFADNKQTVNTR
jgi:hypothetical protein